MLVITLLACSPGSPPSALPVGYRHTTAPAELPPEDPSPPNLVLVILDDVGVERLAAWEQPHDTVPDTPVLDALAQDGMVFTSAYAMPTCSPTRAALLTGRYGRRYGLGKPLAGEPWQLPASEITLPETLASAGYSSAVAGKWHLASSTSESVGHHPLELGFLAHRGSLGNIPYTSWRRYDDGIAATTSTYPTQQTTDDAIALAESLPEPYFLWVAYNAAHAPLHVPPPHLNPAGVTDTSDPTEKLHGMIAAFDKELGRFLATLDLTRTTVLFIGDNGTHHRHVPASWSPTGGKGSVFESGVRVPLLAYGAGVTSGRSDVLVHAVDLFPTLAELAGVPSARPTTAGRWELAATGPAPWLEETGQLLDGTSFAAVLTDPRATTDRAAIYTERFLPLGEGPYTLDIQSVRTERWKLIRVDGEDSLHDLEGRHDDGPDLLDADDPAVPIAYSKLLDLLDAHTAELER